MDGGILCYLDFSILSLQNFENQLEHYVLARNQDKLSAFISYGYMRLKDMIYMHTHLYVCMMYIRVYDIYVCLYMYIYMYVSEVCVRICVCVFVYTENYIVFCGICIRHTCNRNCRVVEAFSERQKHKEVPKPYIYTDSSLSLANFSKSFFHEILIEMLFSFLS